jgi:hypothetical protein
LEVREEFQTLFLEKLFEDSAWCSMVQPFWKHNRPGDMLFEDISDPYIAIISKKTLEIVN